jgi:NAD(P)-dependent dehydrogenase (short-subunit alcohol dehydrogenase family)
VRERATRWTGADVPNQQGRTVVITGADTGVGFETAKVLAASGATVVLASRDPERAGRGV